MARQLQIRRGTTAENNGFIGAPGELTYDTERKLVRVHDGSTLGGKIVGGDGGNGDALKNQNLSPDATDLLYNWEGTLEEYNEQRVAELHPEWICLINDDVEPTQDATIVYKETDDIITGQKTFSSSPLVPTVSTLTDDSAKAASTKFVLDVLKAVYPVGSLYMGTQSTCPMATFFGTWELVSSGKALWTGNGSNANTTIDAGLPNITGTMTAGSWASGFGYEATAAGAFYNVNSWGNDADGGAATTKRGIGIDASRSSSIYGKSSTVQPPAYVVNVWRRTA